MAQTVNNRNEWLFGRIGRIIDDKEAMLRQVVLGMLAKTTRIFRYENLPDTISVKDLETQLQVNGFVIWKEVDGKLYTFTGGLGGEPNPYYLPTIAIVANPALRYNETLKIDEECVVMLNDNYYQGLMPLFNKYGGLLVEAELSLKYAIINARVPALVQADDDNTYASAQEFFKKIIDGKDYGIIASENLIKEGIKTHDFYHEAYIKDLIEAIQYIKGSWFNEVGLNAAFNMKREAINEAEAALNEDILYPTVESMLILRQNAIEKVNAMFGTNITVEFDSVWAQNQLQEELAIEAERATVEQLQNQASVVTDEQVEEVNQEEEDRDEND